jgi:DNA-binding transcriptional MerR regulator
MTIEQLAAESGMSVRNIRNHQSRGLLPPPEVRGRTGYYGLEHLARLRLIVELQGEGFNLAAIERVLSTGASDERLLGLRRAIAAPFDAETPEVLDAGELAERFGEIDAKDAARIRKLGLLIPLGGDRFEAPSPALLRAAEEVTRMGISLHAALALVERVSRDCESISRAFVRLYLEEVWQPFARSGQPEEGWEEMVEAINALRAIASETLLAVFKLRMSAEVEEAAAKLLKQQAKQKR